ncbi:hypothetical protein AB6A40_003284 [Gnathostoma spinigerum]|uniref:Sugar phosphate transporter domain-containing protein n=1 Tax=Gnathostoma spinigerum TaxID=75299 RepID=A0ABD6EJY7_9BILA
MGSHRRNETLLHKSLMIFLAVSSYWICSIGLVFLNKHLLSGLKLDAPLFVTWYQCIITLLLCYLCSYIGNLFPSIITYPVLSFDHRVSREVLPLSFVFVAMITTNNLCLKYVGVSFYYVGRSLTTVFNVVCSYLILGQTTSWRAIFCCASIIFGFLLGVNQEDLAGSLSLIGVFFGVLSSLFVALNAIYTQRTLPVVGDDIIRLTMYNNVNATVLFLPFLLLNGEFGTVLYYPNLLSTSFWILLSISGVFGFLMSYVTGWQIQATSPLTHNVSGTAKSAAQTLIAIMWWNEVKSFLWWMSNVIVLLGSAAYTWVKHQEMKSSHQLPRNVKAEDSTSNRPLLASDADDSETV